jgi:hypothetical protein
VGAHASPVFAAWRLPLRTLRDQALPSWFVPGIVGAVLFAKTGLDPHDVMRWSETSVAVRCALWGGWLALTRPAATLLLSPPGSTWVRSAPISTMHPMLASAVAMVLFHAPFGLLFFAGGRALGAVAAVLVATLVSLPLRGRGALGPALGLMLVASGAPSGLAMVAAAGGLAVALPAAWRIAAEPAAMLGFPVPRLPAVASWACNCILHTLRVERGRVLRLLGVLAVAVALFGLWCRNDPAVDPEAERVRNVAVVTVGSVVASGSLLAAVARFRDQAQWFVASSGLPGLRRATVLPLLVIPALLGLAVGLVVSSRGALACSLGAASAVLWVSAAEARDHGRIVVRALLLAAPLGAAVAFSGARVVGVAAGLAATGAAAFVWRSR